MVLVLSSDDEKEPPLDTRTLLQESVKTNHRCLPEELDKKVLPMGKSTLQYPYSYLEQKSLKFIRKKPTILMQICILRKKNLTPVNPISNNLIILVDIKKRRDVINLWFVH